VHWVSWPNHSWRVPAATALTRVARFWQLTADNAWTCQFVRCRTKFLAILIWSLFNPLAVHAPHLLSPFLAHQPSLHWKSQIAYSDMHHCISGINSLIHSVTLASHVSTHLLIHLSAYHLCHHHHSYHPSLLHSFTPGSKPTFSTNPSNSFNPALPSRSQDRTYHASWFIFSSLFL